MAKVKVGFIGVGGIASVHLKNLSLNEHAEIAAVCDLSEERVKEASQLYGAKGYTDIDLMLEKETMDALFICVPPFAHGFIEEKAASKGIHLMVEKPLGLELEGVAAKAKAIEQAGIICASGYCLRYLDTVQKAKEYLQDKEIAMVRGHYLTSFVLTPWYRNMDKSGGQLVEQSTHTLDLIRYLAGDVSTVYANMSLQVMNDVPEIDIPDVTSVSFTLETGAVGHLASSFIQADHNSGVELYGRDFRVVLDNTTLHIIEKNKTVTYKSSIDFYAEQDRAFIEAIRLKNKAFILAPYEEAYKTLGVTLAANESNKLGRAIHLKEFMSAAAGVH
ncbi:Gfo/Idh/MocA family protein [Bacillus sp. UMB0893]|uniref:Gfo/Idh/MocA family protein n=1 Tax=Bacillus sp. UMB0893 TaxID=2066053 RepID=UPI000C769FCD|nr:Gfo/Idh/MocA family oxidoreductase [Bacillus sp. UMB0893]PLR69170.1 gfo/Idh/MocA family oxidoreductase [Bacillus sp. UMB0893]